MNPTTRKLPSFSGQSLKELKDLEWIFIGIHSIAVPVAIIMGLIHDPTSNTNVAILAGLLAIWNVIAGFINHRVKTINRQKYLGIVTQAVITVLMWALIFQFVSGARTAAYGVFSIVIIEGAIRFGLRGGLIMGTVAAIGQAAAMAYREWEYDFAFDAPGYLFWAILFLIIALSVGLVTEETRRERKRSEKLVQERTLSDERHRIARDMHDTVLNTLMGLSLEAHALRKNIGSPNATEKIDHIKNICQRSGQEIRDIIHELRSDAKSESIVFQMSQIVETWQKSTQTDVEFAKTGEDRSLPIITSYHLVNVLSEALTNIRKHASASQVSIALELLPNELRLEIEDNGKGIGYSGNNVYGAGKGKYGILGMKERVEQLNGLFSIDSSAGTRLLISIPLADDKQNE